MNFFKWLRQLLGGRRAPPGSTGGSGGANAGSLITVPVQVFIASFEALPELNAFIGVADIDEAIASINRVWAPANIQMTAASITPLVISAETFPAGDWSDRTALREQMSTASPDGVGWKAVFVDHILVQAGGLYLEAPPNTLWLPLYNNGVAVPAVNWAHEFGHSFGLAHVAGDLNYVMNPMHGAPDNTGLPDVLTADQISAARWQALIGPA